MDIEQRLMKLEIIVEQNVNNIKQHISEDQSTHTEIRNGILQLTQAVNTLTENVERLFTIVEQQQKSLSSHVIWRSRIMGVVFGFSIAIAAGFAIFKLYFTTFGG